MMRAQLNRRQTIQQGAAASIAVTTLSTSLATPSLASSDINRYNPFQKVGTVYKSIRPDLFDLVRTRKLVNRLWTAFQETKNYDYGNWALLYWYNYWRLAPLGKPRIRTARIGIKMAQELIAIYPKRPFTYFWKASFYGMETISIGVLEAAQSLPKLKTIFEAIIRRSPDLYYGNAYIGLAKLYYKAPTFPVSIGDPRKARLYLEKARQYQEKRFALWYLFAAENEIILGNTESGFALLDRMNSEIRPPDIASKIILETSLHDAKAMRQAVIDGQYNKYSWDPMLTPLKI